jgi:hypothetical protein
MGKRTQLRKEAAESSARDDRSSPLLPMIVSAAVAACLTAIIFVAAARGKGARSAAEPQSLSKSDPASEMIEKLLGVPELSEDADIALLNLKVTPGMPAEEKDQIIADCLKTLDLWAKTVALQTGKNLHRYHANPQEFKSEAEWRLAMMCTILGQDFRLRYDPRLTSTERQNAPNQQFFANPHSVFLTGCLGEDRIGSCASLPVLYVAIGRRIGYPMHLVAAKEHLFARWDDGHGTRVNLEAANAGGFTSHPDSYYRTWPKPISPGEEKSGGYLRNLTAEESLAVFLTTRAACLQAGGATMPAINSAAAAYRLAPNLGGISLALNTTLVNTPSDWNAAAERGLRELEETMMHNRRMAERMSVNPQLPNPHLPGHPQPGYPQQVFPHPAAIPQPHHTTHPGSYQGYQNPHSSR